MAHRLVRAIVVFWVVAGASRAAAQTPSARRTGWVFEVHLGSVSGTVPSKHAASQLPPVGPGFMTVLGDPSRRVPSWYFGDGALLANQVVNQSGDPVKIVPLDPVMTSASARRESSRYQGFRVGHTITGGVLLLFAYDKMNARLKLTDEARAAIAATSDSFKPYWASLLDRPCCTNILTSSTATMEEGVGTEKLFSVAAEVRITTIRGWTPYVSAGWGIGWPSATGPEVTLVGHYAATFVNPGVANNGVRFSETDRMRLRYEIQPAPVGILGLGVERDLAKHIGFRVEGRTFISANAVRIRLDTQPVTVATAPVATTRRGMNPSLQVSTNPTITSLSFVGVGQFDTFKGTGDLPSFSAGLFVRF